MAEPIDWTRIRYLIRRSIRGMCERHETAEITQLFAQVEREHIAARWDAIHAQEQRIAEPETPRPRRRCTQCGTLYVPHRLCLWKPTSRAKMRQICQRCVTRLGLDD